MAGYNPGDNGGWAESEAKWQKRRVIALWVALVLFLVGSIALLYGNAHGFFRTVPPDTVPPWPADLP